MRTILQISDLHFGRLDAAMLHPLREAAIAIKPDLTVVSGDLTQRARGWQFREAAHFLDSLPGPRLVVPGNHDVPLYNLPARFLSPLRGFRRSISRDPEPVYTDEEITVLGLNSARSLRVQEGRLNDRQFARMRHVFTLAGETLRLLVCHHPFMITASSDKKPLENATAALETMAECRVDAALTGHLHTSSAECYPIRASDPHRTPWGLVLIQAGTLSLRARGEAGAFNVIRTEKDRISVDRHLWDSDGRAFAISLAETFTRGPHGWSRG